MSELTCRRADAQRRRTAHVTASMRLLCSALVIWSSIAVSGATPVPGLQIFAPGVISSPAYESHPAFSPDGKLLLFVKSEPNFSKWTIWESYRVRSGWSEPVRAAFAKDDVAADPFFTSDGRHVYFISTRLAPGQTERNLDIWVVERRKGGWGAPERLPEPINSAGAEWFPRLQADGSLYFGSDRPGGVGATDIYRARKTAAGWAVSNLGAAVNSPGDEYEFEIAPNGRAAVLMSGRDPESGGDLYLVRRSRGGWSTPERLGSDINTDELEVGPLISRDGNYLYFSSRRSDERLGDIYRIPLSEVLSKNSDTR